MTLSKGIDALSKGIDDSVFPFLSTKLFFCIRFSSASRAHPSQEELW